MRGINKGFLSTLGLPFLSLMYRAIDESQNSILIVETNKQKVLGFVSASTSMRPIYKRMFCHFPSLVAALVPTLIRPRRWKKIWEILHYSQADEKVATMPDFELLSIVVAAENRGTGCADRLFLQLVDHSKACKIAAFKIVVGDSLTTAKSFYQRMGAKAVGKIEVHAGHGSTIYVFEVNEGSLNG